MNLLLVSCSFVVLIILIVGSIRPQLVKMTSRKKVAITFGGILVVLMLITPAQTPELSLAAPYQIVKSGDTSIAKRKRFEVFITSPKLKNSREANAQTAMKAAMDYAKQYHVDAISVFLVKTADDAGTGKNLAVAHYAPDSGGFSGTQEWKWRVKSSQSGEWADYLNE